jgi:glutamine amidotransferase
VHEPEPLLDADLAVLPGVGSAASAMAGLRARRLDEALRERSVAGRPILGICLGLQLALDETEEDGGVAGLGLVSGRAVRLREGRVPRIGWATVEPSHSRDSSVTGPGPGLAPELEAYWFAHSYAAESPATTATSEGLAAVLESGPFVGVQFHPE